MKPSNYRKDNQPYPHREKQFPVLDNLRRNKCKRICWGRHILFSLAMGSSVNPLVIYSSYSTAQTVPRAASCF